MERQRKLTHLTVTPELCNSELSCIKSILFLTSCPLANFHPRGFQAGIHLVTAFIRNWESVFIASFRTPFSWANFMAFIAACISPQLFVALPLTGSAMFLKFNIRFIIQNS